MGGGLRGDGQDTNHLDGLMRFDLLALSVMEFEDDAGAFVELLQCRDGWMGAAWLAGVNE